MRTPRFCTDSIRTQAGRVFPIAFCLALACGQEEVRVYKAPRDVEPVAQTPASSSQGTTDGASAGIRESLSWTLPAGWTEQPGSGMRFATLVIGKDQPPLEIRVTPLTKIANDLHANINRWASQVGLSPMGAEEQHDKLQSFKVEGRQVSVIDLVGPSGTDGAAQEIMAAMLEAEQNVWFLVVQGDENRVTPHRQAFVDFMRTVRVDIEKATGTQGMGAALKQSGGSPSDGSGAPATGMTYDLPQGWTSSGAPSGPRFATIKVDGQPDVEVAITRFPGSVGGLLANVNRWRGQLSLEPVNSVEAQPMELWTVDGESAPWMDLHGNGTESKRMFVLLTQRSGTTWFVKMTGPVSALEEQIKTFKAFAESIQFSF